MLKKRKTIQELLPPCLVRRRSGAVFEDIDGLTLDGYRGHYEVEGQQAIVEFEQAGWIRVTCPVTKTHAGAISGRPRVALEANCGLPSNVRFATRNGGDGELAMVADTLYDGERHLKGTFAEIRAGMALALNGAWGAPRPRTTTIPSDLMKDSMAQLDLGDRAVVERSDGWEIRPRIRGSVRAVRATLDGDALRLSRRLSKSLPGDLAAVVAAQALRFNDRLRLCRLSIIDGNGLCVETRLRGELVSHYWIREAARAVAAASGLCAEALTILTKDERIARCYAWMFSVGCNNGLKGNERG